jgi:predicted transposase YbfD/YdcC
VRVDWREGGHYLFVVKENQPTLRADLVTAFDALDAHLQRTDGVIPTWLQREWTEGGIVFSHYRETDTGHGRIEEREAWALSDPELNGYVGSAGTSDAAWPDLQQIVRIRRERTIQGRTTHETVYLVTSVPPSQADAKRLLGYNRSYWSIENRLHWVRDETLGEDRSQVRSGSAPQVMAALRNLLLTLLRRDGAKNIAAALRTLAARPKAAVTLVLSAHQLQ